MSDQLVDEAYALSQRLFDLWASGDAYPGAWDRIYRVFRRAANRAIRRIEKRTA